MIGPINKNYLLPAWSIVWASCFCIILIGSAYFVLTHHPWIGVSLGLNHKEEITVLDVYEGSPAHGLLNAGDVILALLDENNVPFPLKAIDLKESHSDLALFKQFQFAMQRQSRISHILEGSQVGFLLPDKQIVTLRPFSTRSFTSVPFGFWIILFIGSASFLISFMTWRLRVSSIATRIFLVCGIGTTICAWASSIYISREIAIDGALLSTLIKMGNSGAEITAYSCVALIWSYPKPIARFPVVFLVSAIALLDIVRVFFEITDIPGHSFVIGIVSAVPIGIVFSILQWRNADGKPDDKAVLKWVNLSIYTAVIAVMILYFIPISLNQRPVVDITFAFIIMLFVFLGFAFAITRYRLFDIERWWSDIWLWFFAGLTIVVVDLSLVLFTNINQGIALTAVLFVVGWIYFPMRQRLWSKIFRYRKNNLEEYLPVIVEALTEMRGGSVDNLWRNLLHEIFQPLAIDDCEYLGELPQIREEGLVLTVPSGTSDNRGLQLRLAAGGRRLFLHEDVKLSTALHHLVFDKHNSIASYMKGAQEERHRIVRDLHDDVAGKLLAMKLISPDTRYAGLADDALKALRSVIYSLDSNKGMSLQDAVIRWKEDMYERCHASKITLEISLQDGLSECILTPRQMLNYERIIHEGVTNAIVHSSTNKLSIDISFRAQELILVIQNDGNKRKNTNESGQGIGLLNISQRMLEMGGRMEYEDDQVNGIFRLCCVNPFGDDCHAEYTDC
jgi:signal transduction histidine kinase